MNHHKSQVTLCINFFYSTWRRNDQSKLHDLKDSQLKLIFRAAFSNTILQLQHTNRCGFVHVMVPVVQLWGENHVEMKEGGKQLESSSLSAVTPMTCDSSDWVAAGHWASNVNRKYRDSNAMCWALRAFTLPWPWAPWLKQISIWNTWSTGGMSKINFRSEMTFTDFSFWVIPTKQKWED